MNYFLAPRSGEKSYENYKSTIKGGVDYHLIVRHLTAEGREKVSRQDVIYAWGNREGTKTQWERMNYGDTVIFYAKGKLVMAATVYYKQHDAGLALAMWPADEKGRPWEYTFFLKDLHYINIPMAVFNRIAGFKTNFVLQGFTHLKEHRVDSIIEQFGSVEKLLESFENEQSEEAPLSSDPIYVNLPDDVSPVIVHNPAIGPKAEVRHAKAGDKPFKIDYVERSRKNAVTGSKGEEMVLKAEKKHLLRLREKDLAETVTRVSLEDDSLGYDILSFETDGTPKYIEVKTSTAKTDAMRFYISAKEFEASKKLKNYHLYLVDGVNSKSPRITIIPDPFGSGVFSITPDTYIVEGRRL